MRLKRVVLLGCIIGVIFVISLFAGCKRINGVDMKLHDSFITLLNALEQEAPDGLCLKIYYLDPSILTRAPLTTEDLINFPGVKEIIVDCQHLKEHVDLLNQMKADNLVPVKNSSNLNARLCYIFETNSDGKILEIAAGGAKNSVFVNGIEVEYNDLFRNVIIPFLTDEELIDVEHIFAGEYYKK